MAVVRTRVAMGLVSMGVIILELALMRGLAIRFWSHLAWMVISVALLGFAASGTALTLLRRRIMQRPPLWAGCLALGFALSVPLVWWAWGHVSVDVAFLAWSLSQVPNVIALELLMLVPFLLAAGVIGIVLMDKPDRLSGHYAANLLGSGLGGAAAVLLMFVLNTQQLACAAAGAGCLGGLLLLGKRPLGVAASCLAGAALIAGGILLPLEPRASPYKMLAQARTWPGTRLVCQAEGPLGRIDVIAGEAVHYAPGLSLQYTEAIPPHALIFVDGEQAGAVYDCRRAQDWGFLDYTTAAAPYHLRAQPNVCVVGAGGGEQIGLAIFHQSPRVTALEMNSQIIDLMTGAFFFRGGRIYQVPGVSVLAREARGFFAGPGEGFDIIQAPPVDVFGASGAGLYASQECYLYTVEAFEAMWNRLRPGGVLCVTRWARMPPRDELRAFDMAVQMLRRGGVRPDDRLAWIRSWATVTLLVFRDPISDAQAQSLRAFCRQRSFDVCYLPGLKAEEANQYHVLERPYYFEAAAALLGPGREAFLSDYLFDVAAATDDRPYYYHCLRWRSLSALAAQIHAASRAFVEAGYLMTVAALAQAIVFGALLIVVPLAPGAGALRNASGKGPSLAYFFLIGTGFMLLEIGYLQKLILYLAHPIYSAAAVISSFLVFAGLGSQLSGRWPAAPKRIAAVAAAATAGLGGICLLVVDPWLRLTQSAPMPARFAIAAVTVAPLALAMGHLFPAALRQVAGHWPPLGPWVWAVNGFASVVATAAAPILAMAWGFRRVTLVAIACYALAGLVSRWLPGDSARTLPP